MLTEIVAHRGYSKVAPENTMVAFKKALALNIDVLEIDVHLTKDQQLVIIHDESVERTSNGQGMIKDKTLNELLKLDFGRWFAPEYCNEKIPLLKDLLNLLAEIKFDKTLLIEIKTDHVAYEGIEAVLIQTLAKYDTNNYHIILQSFNLQTLININKINDKLDLAALIFYPTWQLLRLDNKNLFTAIHPDNRWLINRYFWFRPTKVRPWKINKVKDMKIILKHNLQGLITDEVELALALRKEIQGG